MKPIKHHLLLLLLLTALAAPSQAAFVTDKLLAGLYPTAKAEGDPIKILPSGTPVEVLQQQEGFARVRLGDRTEGWIESGYLTEEKPARVMLLEQQARANTLQQKLRQAEDELKQLRAQKAATEKSATRPDPALRDKLQRENVDLQQQIEALQQERDRLLARIRAVREALDMEPETQTPATAATGGATAIPPLGAWYLPLLGAMLVIGFIAGIAFKNYRIARRYGGFRI